MATVLLTKRIEFAASHRYYNDRWDAARNRMVFGACNNEHGHNYLLEVTIGGEVDDATGMVVNLYDLKQVLDQVLVEFDHKHLNLDTPYFDAVIPTTENIAHVLWNILARRREIGELRKIALWEDEDLSAEITGEDVEATPASATVIRRYRFSAGHRLQSAHLSPTADESLYGTCRSPHGHDYVLEVAVRGAIDADTGMVTDIAALDRVVEDQVVKRFDGRDLNRDPVLGDRPPTGAMLARSTWRLLAEAIPVGRLERLVLADGRGQSFAYREPGRSQDCSK
jgi:6-pyruvoyltetrahydropterin/6-carboxytetrahydropterin synthase